MGRINRVSFLIAGLLFIPAMLFAQFNNSTTSPYSRYGLGDLHSYSFGRTTAMGGATLASRNKVQINSANPASYTALDSLNFLFEFGLSGDFADYKTDVSKLSSNDINFNYFAMSFRITKWMATSIGLKPVSDVGYLVQTNDEFDNTGAFYNIYWGEGTISDAFFGLAIEPVKNISVGFNLNYLFGNLKRNSQSAFSNAGYYQLSRNSETRIRDFGLNFGIQGTLPMKDDKELVLAAVLENNPTYTAFESDIVRKTLSYSTSTDIDTLLFRDEERGKIKFPNTLGAGVSLSKKDVYEINLDYYHQGWSDATFFGDKSEFLTDLNKFAVGAEWIPDKFSIRSVLKRFAYRAGLKYEQTYHSLAGQQINDFGISFGLGIPIYRSNSTLNVGAELGKRGTTENNLVRENYAKINLSVTLHDFWFMQRKID